MSFATGVFPLRLKPLYKSVLRFLRSERAGIEPSCTIIGTAWSSLPSPKAREMLAEAILDSESTLFVAGKLGMLVRFDAVHCFGE